MIDIALKESIQKKSLQKKRMQLKSSSRLFPVLDFRSSLWLGLSWLTLGLPTLIYPIGRDQGVFAYIGERLFAGDRLYVDLWDVKSPLVYWMYGLALKFSDSHIIGVRIMDMLISAVCAYLVYALAVNLRVIKGTRSGVVAGMLYLAWYYLPNDFRVLANCESFITPCLLLGIVFLVRATEDDVKSNWWMFFSGVALGATVLFKTTGVVFAAPAMFAVFFVFSGKSWRSRIVSVAAIGIGFALPVLLGWVYLLRTGAMDEWLFMNLIYLPSYTKLSHTQGFISELMTPLWIIVALIRIYPAMIAGFAFFGLRLVWSWYRRSESFGGRRSEKFGALYVVLGFGLMYALVVALQGKYLHYHFLPLLGPFAVFVTIVTMRVFEDFRTSGLVKTISLVILFLGLAHSLEMPGRYVSLAKMVSDDGYSEVYCEELSGGNYPCATSHKVGTYLREESEVGDRLFVWSFEPEIYFLSGLEPSSRFLFNTPFFAGEEFSVWKDELMIDLMSKPPAFIVIGENDGLPKIAGGHYSSKDRLGEVQGLPEFISNNYSAVEVIGNFTILKRLVFGRLEIHVDVKRS